MRGYSHNGALAVTNQNVVGNPDRHFLAGGRVDGIRAGEDPSFFFVFLAFDVGFFLGFFNVGFYLGASVVSGEGGDERMFGGEHQERRAEDSVWAGREDPYRTEVYLRAFAAADPVLLHRFNFLGPIEGVDVGE